MSLDLSSVGHSTAPFTYEYDWKTVVLYALGVGATREELDFLYEKRGPRVLPTFAVVPAYPACWALFEKARCDLTRLVHGWEVIRLHAPIPPAGKLETVGVVKGIYDMKKLAQVVLATTTTFKGEPCFETEMTLLIRDAGGFGGDRPPKSEAPKIPEGNPDFTVDLPTSPEQALLYRLSGDLNPLHADPEFAKTVGFEGGPILHGLCTFGVLGRAVLKGACGGDERRLRALGAQFRRPVWPGESLRTTGYVLESGRIALEAFAGDKPDPVITSAWADVAPPRGA
ncbi:MAG TPA: MaoC/PaaZ C-terminal domain-containing protein [Polyangiaceae bacterium]|jgi:acyl dehydratase|nr:MaoC/PaaZ C-terminal domain-containing protein [Polyangiaceae bacterium]